MKPLGKWPSRRAISMRAPILHTFFDARAGLLSALNACRPHPTLILQLEDLQADLNRFTFKLYAMLGQAGVIGLQMPRNRVMRQEFGSYLKAKRPVRLGSDQYTSARLSRSQVRVIVALRCLIGANPYKNSALAMLTLFGRLQEALHRALQMVSNSPDYGLGSETHRAEAVMSVFEDLMRTWNLRSGDAEMDLSD